MRKTFEGKEYIIIACIWLLIGLLSVTIMCVHDMRGESYDENYFEGEIYHVMGFILMGGFTFLIVVCLIVFEILRKRHEKRKDNRKFTKFIYKIANIGIKKDGDKK